MFYIFSSTEVFTVKGKKVQKYENAKVREKRKRKTKKKV
jgi:hypothetical protein